MPTDDDPFERAARREAQIAEELAEGRLSPEQAEQLRDLLGADREPERGEDDVKSRLSLSQLRRVLEEGVEPEALASALRHLPNIGVDDLISLLVDYGPDEEFISGLADAGLSGIDHRALEALLDHGVEPEALVRLRRSGLGLQPRDLARLCDDGVDWEELADLAEQSESLLDGGARLTVFELARVAGEGVDLEGVAGLIELGFDFDLALEVAGSDIDPTTMRRLRDEGVDIDWHEVLGQGSRSPWPVAIIGFKGRRRHLGLILGDHVVAGDVTVSGVVVGSVTVRPGARVSIDALVTGDLIVQTHAAVVIGGTVRARVRNHGGQVEVLGTVRGGVEDVVGETV